MSYSAGSAFVSIAPSLRGFQEKLKTQLAPLIKPISLTVVPDVDDTNARTQLDALARARSTTLTVDLDSAAASAKYDVLARNRSSTLNVDADTGAATAKLLALGALAASISGGSGVAALGALAVPVGAGAAGAGAAGSAAFLGAGGAGAILGASLLGNIKAVIDAQKNLETAQKAGASAAAAETAAQNGVASAMSSLQSAQFGVTSAEQSLTSAQQNAKSAQDALNQARETAREQLQGLEDSLRGAALAESGSKLNLAQAELNLRTLKRSGVATTLQLQQAEQAVKEARLAADVAADNNRTAKKDAAEARKAGVDGNAQVVSARQQLTQANQGVVRAEQQLAQAHVQVANAQRQVAYAQQQAATAATASATAQAAIAKATDALDSGPAKAFAKALTGVKDAFGGFLKATAGSSLGLATKGLDLVAKLLPGLAPVAKVAGGAVSRLLNQFSNFATGPGGRKFLGFLTTFGGVFISQFGKIGLNVMRGLLHVFEAFAPLSKGIGDGLVTASVGFAKMTARLGQSKGFQAFLAYIKDTGPKVLALLGNLATVAGKFVVALAPVGALVLTGLLAVSELLANLPTDALLAVIAGLGALVAFAFPIIGLSIAIGALAALFISLYNTSSEFRDSISGIGDAFKPLAAQFKTLMKPAVDVYTSYVGLMTEIWRRFGEDITDFAKTYLSGLIDTVRGLLKILAGVFKLATDILKGDWQGVWDDLGEIVDGAWDVIKGTVKVVFSQLKLAFQVFGGILSTIWSGIWEGVKNVAVGAINGIIWVLDKLIDGINFLTHFVGIPAIPHIPPIGQSSSGPGQGQDRSHTPGGGFAQGGVLPGFTPGRDVHHFVSATGGHLDLSGGEGILIPQATRMLGGAAGIKAINRRAQAFAAGGVFRPIGPAGQLSGNGLHDSYTGFPALDFGAAIGTPVYSAAPGKVTVSRDILGDQVGGYASYGRYIQVLHNGFETLYAHLSERLASVGQLIGAGGQIGLSGDTGHTYGAHLHFGSKGRDPYSFVNGRTDYPGTSAFGVPTPGGIGLPGIPGLDIPNPFNYLRDKISDALGSVRANLDSPFGQMLGKIPGQLLGPAASYVKGKLGGLLDGLNALHNPVTGVGIPGNVQSYIGVVDKVLAELSPTQPRYLDSYVLARMAKESSGNPTIVNKWDSNWDAGTPSVGLMQVIGPTFDAFAGPFRNTGPFLYGVSTNPEANIYAGLNYALHSGKYSGILDAMTQPGGYDNGGVARGKGWMFKNIIEPERVLGPSSTSALDAALRDLGQSKQTRARPTAFNLYDKDDVLIGTMHGVARDEVDQAAAQDFTLAGADA